MENKNIKIILENGITIKCKYFGYKKEVYGTFIFNTSIVGYEEALTDPSYNNEILVMTFPQQGIYGINLKDMESKKIHPSALIVNTFETNWSNNHGKISIDEFLKKYKILGVYDLDTRYLTKIIRIQGSLKGAIVDENKDEKEVLEKIKNWNCVNQVEQVSPNKIEILNKSGKKTIVFYDFGAKDNIKKEFIKRNYKLVVVPFNTKLSKALEYKPDFIFLSNGPGDPATLTDVIKEVKKMIDKKIKLVGICLGHQLIGLAMGLKTHKLKFGHHSINHPVRDVETGKVYITSQNHNYAVDEKNKFPKHLKVFLKSLNDNSVEGMKSESCNLISTQFHPEAAPGTSDANEIFDLFIKFNNEEK